MHPDLERLLELQAKDLELLGTDLRLKAVGEEIAGLAAALARARAAVEGARGRGAAEGGEWGQGRRNHQGAGAPAPESRARVGRPGEGPGRRGGPPRGSAA